LRTRPARRMRTIAPRRSSCPVSLSMACGPPPAFA
jgi:hypothetical protein